MIADNKVTEAAARKQLADATVAAAAPTATETVESLAARIESMAAQLDAISHSVSVYRCSSSSAPISRLAALVSSRFLSPRCHGQVVQMEARIAKVERTQEEMRWG